MRQFEDLQILTQTKIPVNILEQSPLKLENLTDGVGVNNTIEDKELHRPQLALAGYVGLFNFKRIQIFGSTEVFYLKSLTKNQRIKAFKTICEFPIPCIVLTTNHKLEQELIDIAKEKSICVYSTPYDTTKATYTLSEFLDDQFSPQAVVHGSFVDVYGVGILFTGRSGIGKSEIALDLVERGHRLVADDVVMITKKRQTTLMGTGTSLVQHFMEIRGLGIIDVRQMFGIRSIRFQKRLEIVVELEDWKADEEYSRTGLDEEPTNVMGVEIMTVKLPIFPGKNITVIAEVIAINYLLRTYGYNASQIFSDKLKYQIKNKTGPDSKFQQMRIIPYLQGDTE